jgi:hypothetical protein
MKLDQPAQVQDENIRTLVKGYPRTEGRSAQIVVNEIIVYLVGC